MWVRVTDAKKNNAGYFVIEIETEDAIFENGKKGPIRNFVVKVSLKKMKTY